MKKARNINGKIINVLKDFICLKNLFETHKLLLLIPVLLTGCATNKMYLLSYQPLNPELIHKYNINVISNIPSDKPKIKKDLRPSRGEVIAKTLVFGLAASTQVGNLGLKQVAGDPEKTIIPLRKAVGKFNLRTVFWGELEKYSTHSQWLNIENIEKIGKTEKSPNPDEIIEAPILKLYTEYSFIPDSSILEITTRASLHLNSLEQRDYNNVYIYFSKKIGEEKESEAIASWAKNDAKLYRDIIAEGVTQILEMLKYDLLDLPNRQEQLGEHIQYKSMGTLGAKDLIYEGQIISKNGNRVLMRDKYGNLVSFEL